MQIKEKLNSYWNHAADEYNQYSSENKQNDPGKVRWQSLFTSAFPKDATTVLDVGTGPGNIAMMLAELGYDVTGVDLSSTMLKFARQNAEIRNLSIKYEQSDAESLPFEDNSFDVVVSRHVLWTTTDPEKVLMEWMRVLKPTGRIVYVDGNWYRSDGTLKRKLWMGLSMFLKLITEFRDPRSEDFTEEMKKDLWSVKNVRPQYDLILLEKIGFRDITVKKSINREVFGLMDYLKSGYWGPTFMVFAEKPQIF